MKTIISLALTLSMAFLSSACIQKSNEADNAGSESTENTEATMTVKKINGTPVNPQDVPAVMAANSIVYTPIDVVNWNEFPYAPKAEVALAYTEDALLIHYKVNEDDVIGTVTQDHGTVWLDSCVETFFRPFADGGYYNLECNCLGTMLIAYGKDRYDREPADAGTMAGVKRWASLGREAFGEKLENTSWEIALIVPFSTFFKDEIKTLEGMESTVNFYKCGGKGEYEHYLTWSPVGVEKPDYHQSSFFGKISFK